MLTFLTSPLGRYLLAALAVLTLLGSIYGAGHHSGADSIRKADAKVQAKAQADVKAHEEKAATISSTASAGLVKAKAATSAKFKGLGEKVAAVDTADVDRACVVPKGWVDLWNAGAQP